MSFWTWLFPEKEVEPEAVDEIEVKASPPIPIPTEVPAPHKSNGHDARATAAEEALAAAMEDLKNDDFDERVQNLTIGTESLSQEQIQSILKSSRLKSKPI